jgi:hypothetical protein
MSDKLKEYIKSLIAKKLEEESVSGDAGAYSTPFAFSKKGQKMNKATKAASDQGMKKAPGMPKNSKVFDYKELWKGKKSAMNEETGDLKIGDKVKYENQEWEIINFLSNGLLRLKSTQGLPSTSVLPNKVEVVKESNYDKASPSVSPSNYTKASPSSAPSLYLQKSSYTSESMKKPLLDIIEQELLSEGSYSKFKKEVSFRTKSEQLHKAIREVKRKLGEIDRIVEYTSRMKQELSEDGGLNYWKATQNNLSKISEMVENLNSKIKKLN